VFAVFDSSHLTLSSWVASAAAHHVPVFALMNAAAWCLAVACVALRVPRAARSKIAFGAAVGAPLGAVLLACFFELPHWLAQGHAHGTCAHGFFMAYGALFGVVLGTGLGARWAKMHIAQALDAVAPALGIMVFCGRVGCLFAGCDFGRPSNLPWAISYSAHTPAFDAHVQYALIPAEATRSLPVHPTQLYEALVGLVVLLLSARRTVANGSRLVSALACYAAGRFCIEFLRGDAQPRTLGLDVPQWLSVMVLCAIACWATSGKRAKSAF
jgi:prolipoprotein diacylglyceryltransferase